MLRLWLACVYLCMSACMTVCLCDHACSVGKVRELNGACCSALLADTEFCLPGQVLDEDSTQSLSNKTRRKHVSVASCYPKLDYHNKNKDVRRPSVLEEVDDYARLFTGSHQRKKSLVSSNIFKALRTGVGIHVE